MNIRRRPGHRDERGQILVIFAGGLVALLAIAALVFDVGSIFMLRRQEQNAADPGAIAAARYLRPTATISSMQQAACWYARQNGFFESAASNSDCTPANDSEQAVLTVNSPPSVNAGASYVGRPGFVEVSITRTHKSFFAGLLGRSTFQVSANAVAAYTDGNSNSNSLVSLDPSSTCNTGSISGGGTINITPQTDPSTGLPYDGGYVYVNSSCGASPNNVCDNTSTGGLTINGSNSTLNAPKVFTRGTCVKANNNFFNAPLTEGSVQIGDPLADIPTPSFSPPGAYCGDPLVAGTPQTDQTTSKGCDFKTKDATYNLDPGVYYGGWSITGQNVTLHLDPGIYIIAGGGIQLGATGTISSVEGATGPAPVMIFSTDNPLYAATCKGGGGSTSQCQNKLDFTAGSDLLLSGLTSGPYKGILIWQDGDGSGATAGPKQAVNLAGQGSLTLSGTIYAPRGQVTLTGGSTGTGYAAVQIIAWRFAVSGGGTLNMPYDPTKLYQFEQLGLVK